MIKNMAVCSFHRCISCTVDFLFQLKIVLLYSSCFAQSQLFYEDTEVVRHLGSEVVRYQGSEIVRLLGSEVVRH